MKKRILPILMAIAIMVGCMPFASAAAIDTRPYPANSFGLRSNPQTVTANSSTGVTDSFTVHELGRVRFFVWNANGVEDLTITIHKQNSDGTWSGALKRNGETSFPVSAGANVLFDTDESNWAAGTYRFEAASDQGDEYDYYVDTRELDYTP